MKLISTRDNSTHYSLREALLAGLAPDGGLFIPIQIDPLPSHFFLEMNELSFLEIATEVSARILGTDELTKTQLSNLLSEILSFPVPLVSLDDNISILELFHGPSLAFKDFGAQFMARLISVLHQDEQDLVVLVATSGDTGGAVAAGFHGVPNIKVIILYPEKGVSDLQYKQLTTFGDNIYALAIQGSFDDCQALVKEAFRDTALRNKVSMTSANSINIGRLIPQSFYYFEGFRQLPDQQNGIIFSVPSGNFGNLTAGLFAKQLGLPVNHFLAATNVNDVVPLFLKTGQFDPRPSVTTISNAMDVGNPSNFERMTHLFNSSTWNISESDLIGYSFTDQQTIACMHHTYLNHQYTLDPHGAVSVLAAQQYLKEEGGQQIICLETAHPSKFRETVESAINTEYQLHPTIAQLLHQESSFQLVANVYERVKECILAISQE